MKINCLSCGHNVELSEAYDDYSGMVKCFVCAALLEIRAEDGNIRSVQLTTRPSTALVNQTVPTDKEEPVSSDLAG
jgi:hypothetical protein